MKQVNRNKVIQVTDQRYRPRYHIATPGGWLNDPNGLCYYQGYYHVFYQYHPYSAEWGPMHWGHVRSKDLVHWEQLPVALVPGDPEDTGGCFSGSAMVKDGRLYLLYTGHHYYDDGDQDHFWENQNVAYSDDGIHFTKYAGNPVISAPADNSQDFRDPKVWQHQGKYYLVLGSRERATNQGRILLYQSTDLLHWKLSGTMFDVTTVKNTGKMLECPDFFHLAGKDILLCSSMGLPATAKNFMNLSQVCYSVGQLDYANCRFTGTDLQELDKGHNFYATQTMATPDQRRIMIAWTSPFEESMPEKADGWAGILTIPRELTLRDGHLYNQPVREMATLRVRTDYDGQFKLAGRRELTVSDPQHSEFTLTFPTAVTGQFSWQLNDQQGQLISLTYRNGELVLDRRGPDGKRYAELPAGLRDLRIFVDTSSVEIFVNSGWVSFTDRYYATGRVSCQVTSDHEQSAQVQIYTLGTEKGL